MSEHKVGDVARMSGVSVRALHHYDEIGLLVPTGRTDAGYRLYSDGDLRRLQQILFYRELDFGLDRIAEILAGPGAPADEHLRRQHRLLCERLARTEGLLRAIEHEMEARRMGIPLTPQEQLEVFGTDQLAEYGTEAERRWGPTDAWKQSQRRSSAYTKEDWVEMKRASDATTAAFAAAAKSGAPATGEVAMGLAEEHRRHISRWFYDCSHQFHCGLAEMYVSDQRFTRAYDEIAPGLSRYVHDAILANAAANGGA